MRQYLLYEVHCDYIITPIMNKAVIGDVNAKTEKKTSVTLRRVASLSLPIALQNIISTAAGSADVIMVGRVGQDDLSAVSLAGQAGFILGLILLGVTIGTSLLVSQYYGREDYDTIARIQGYAVKSVFVITSVFALISVLFSDAVMGIFTKDTRLIMIGAKYLRIVGLSFIFTGISQVMETVMKAVTRVRVSSMIGIAGLLLNVAFNFILIFGHGRIPALGVSGAALGTLLSRLIEVGCCIVVSKHDGYIPLKIRYLFCTYAKLRKQYRHFTLPITLNGLSWGTAFASYSVILGHLGNDVVAAAAVASVARNFAMVGCSGIASGAGIYLGTELGSGMTDSVKTDATLILKLTFAIGSAGGLLIAILRPFICRMSALSASAGYYLNVMLTVNAVYILVKSYNCVFNNGILSAGGDTHFGLVCDTIDMWCYSVPLGFLAAFVWHFPPLIIYILISTDELVKLPFYYMRYKKGVWIRNIT